MRCAAAAGWELSGWSWSTRFTVPVPVAEAWDVLLDVERIAPCMPGATVDSFDGETINGRVKVKVGPIQVTYAGTARFIEKDEAARRAVIEASGKEARGSGTAAATITARAAPTAGAARPTVIVTTDLAITGKPAQFGRGVMAEVGNKLLGRFADCLADELTGGTPAPAAEPVAEAAPAPAGRRATNERPGGSGRRRDDGHAHASGPAGAGTDPDQLRARPAENDTIDLLDVAGGADRQAPPPVGGRAGRPVRALAPGPPRPPLAGPAPAR